MTVPRIIDNPFATEHAAELLESEGKHNDAAAVRAQIDPSDSVTEGGDPLDYWLAVEELGATQED